MLGVDTCFLTGTDEHGQKIERAAEAAGKPPQQFADKVSAEFRGLWDRMGITYDDYIRTTERPPQARRAEPLALASANAATSTRAPTPANTASSTSSTWTPPPATPCPDCGRPTETVNEENYFFKLSAFERPLLEFYAENPDFIRPETRRNEVIAFVSGGLRDLSV